MSGRRSPPCRAGAGGWPTEGVPPFDAIVGSAAAREIPSALIDQLADGGRLVMPVGDFSQHLVLLQQRAGQLRRESLLPVRFVPMR